MTGYWQLLHTLDDVFNCQCKKGLPRIKFDNEEYTDGSGSKLQINLKKLRKTNTKCWEITIFGEFFMLYVKKIN